MLFVMADLTGDLSSGVNEMAKENLEIMVRMCGAPLEGGQRYMLNCFALHLQLSNLTNLLSSFSATKEILWKLSASH